MYFVTYTTIIGFCSKRTTCADTNTQKSEQLVKNKMNQKREPHLYVYCPLPKCLQYVYDKGYHVRDWHRSILVAAIRLVRLLRQICSNNAESYCPTCSSLERTATKWMSPQVRDTVLAKASNCCYLGDAHNSMLPSTSGPQSTRFATKLAQNRNQCSAIKI